MAAFTYRPSVVRHIALQTLANVRGASMQKLLDQVVDNAILLASTDEKEAIRAVCKAIDGNTV